MNIYYKDCPRSLSGLHHRRGMLYTVLGLAALLMVISIFAATLGSVSIPFTTIWQVMLSRLPLLDIPSTWVDTTETIIIDIRIPRVILAGIVGAALAVAGATYQGLFRNPLADPYLIGVAQGAGLGAIIAFLLPSGLLWTNWINCG